MNEITDELRDRMRETIDQLRTTPGKSAVERVRDRIEETIRETGEKPSFLVVPRDLHEELKDELQEMHRIGKSSSIQLPFNVTVGGVAIVPEPKPYEVSANDLAQIQVGGGGGGSRSTYKMSNQTSQPSSTVSSVHGYPGKEDIDADEITEELTEKMGIIVGRCSACGSLQPLAGEMIAVEVEEQRSGCVGKYGGCGEGPVRFEVYNEAWRVARWRVECPDCGYRTDLYADGEGDQTNPKEPCPKCETRKVVNQNVGDDRMIQNVKVERPVLQVVGKVTVDGRSDLE